MKKQVFLVFVFTLFLAVAGINAQDKTNNFAGTWELDSSKSKLDERMRIKTVTMTVSQTDKELKVESQTNRPVSSDPASPAGVNSGGGMRGIINNDGTITYSLDGKETKIQQESPMGQVPVTLKAKFEKEGKLDLSSVRVFKTQMGEVTMTIKETWELAPDGKTLKIKRSIESPRGTQTSEMVFNKK